MLSLSSIARAYATAIPLSAPNVVPSAFKKPSSTNNFIPSFSKLNFVFQYF